MNMKKIWLAGMAFALAVASPALAGTRTPQRQPLERDGDDGGGDTFSAATLNGTYVFEASGFADDGKVGEVAVLGTLTFDGVGAVTGNLILTRGDNAQNSCADTFTTGGTYSFTGGRRSGAFHDADTDDHRVDQLRLARSERRRQQSAGHRIG